MHRNFGKSTSRTLASALACGIAVSGACGGPSQIEADAGADAEPAVTSTVFAVAGVFMGGDIASTIELPSLELTRGVVAGVASSDPVVRHHDGRLYIINRFGHDNVTILDAASLALIAQISTGAGSNPQDVAAAGSTVYVVALAEPDVLVLDAADPNAGVVRRIPLPVLDPEDGIPDCHSIALVDTRLFVSCGILDLAEFPVEARGPGKIAVIDTVDDSVEAVLDLANPNPFGFLQPTPADSAFGGDLLVATVDFGDLSARCLERISVGATPEPLGCVVTNADLGGYASGFAYGPGDTLYIAVTSGFDQNGTIASVWAFSADSGMLDSAPLTGAGQQGFDVAVCPTGELVIADATGGLRIYEATGEELTTEPLDIGLPPVANGMVCY